MVGFFPLPFVMWEAHIDHMLLNVQVPHIVYKYLGGESNEILWIMEGLPFKKNIFLVIVSQA